MFRAFAVMCVILLVVSGVAADDCVTCHKEESPGAVADWEVSKHAQNGITCDFCHGDAHSSGSDVEKVLTVTPETLWPGRQWRPCRRPTSNPWN
jgi:hypothetical protein